MAKANQRFRSYTVADTSELDAAIQDDLIAMDGWKIVHLGVDVHPAFIFAWVLYELP